MEDNSNNQRNRVHNPSSSPRSAEEKLKKSMKGLTHMGGSMGGGMFDASTSSSAKSKTKTERKKVGGVVLDIDTIEGANKQGFETRGRRNNIIIIVLSLLLVVSLVFLAMSIMGYRKNSKKANLIYTTQGDAEWIIEGGNTTEILLKDGLARDMVYLIDSDLKITTSDSVNVVVEIEVLLEGSPILIAGIDANMDKWSRIDGTNNYKYNESIIGGGTIQVFDGLDFSNAPLNLSSNNIKINVKAIVTKN